MVASGVQFVRSTGRLGGHREQLLVAHAFLAPLGLHVRLPAQGLGHLHHEEVMKAADRAKFSHMPNRCRLISIASC